MVLVPVHMPEEEDGYVLLAGNSCWYTHDVLLRRVHEEHEEHEEGTPGNNAYCRESTRNADDNRSWKALVEEPERDDVVDSTLPRY